MVSARSASFNNFNSLPLNNNDIKGWVGLIVIILISNWIN